MGIRVKSRNGSRVAQQNHKISNEKLFRPLFEGAVAGDRKAHSELLTQLSLLAKKYVRRKIGEHADSDDLIQEILISVHKALHTYDPARPCMPWLGAIMHYRLTDWLRSRYSPEEQHKIPLEDVEEFLSEGVTESPLEYEYVNKAVGVLPEGQQAVIRSMYHEELTVAETSAKLGISISAVKVTAHRAYKKLRERLKEE